MDAFAVTVSLKEIQLIVTLQIIISILILSVALLLGLLMFKLITNLQDKMFMKVNFIAGKWCMY